MDSYRSFGELRINELTVLRQGFFRPWYELTDGQFIYGKLTHTGWTNRSALLQTAEQTWEIKPGGFFSRTLLIQLSPIDITGRATPKNWSLGMSILMNNGFEALLATKKIFTKTHTLLNDQYGDILTIEQNFWHFKTPFKITFSQALLKDLPDLPLLILLCIQLVLMRQQAAATT